jgi:glutathione S-transferase
MCIHIIGLILLLLYDVKIVKSFFKGFNMPKIEIRNIASPRSGEWEEFQKTAPSWEILNEVVRAEENVEERTNYDDELRGYGPANHRSNIRLFDAHEGTVPEVVLFRDEAAWCPYCEKVWLQLEEKRIPYEVKKSALRCYGDKTPEHLRVNPSGMLPVAIVKGRVISESNEIMQILEDEFPSHKPLLPAADDPQQQRVMPLLQLERRIFGSWFSWLTAQNRDESRAMEMESLLCQVDNELATGSSGPYFLGEDLSLVDIMFAPFLERMAASLPYFKGFTVRDERFPSLLKWYEAMDNRKDTYAGIKSDYYTHNMDLPPQIGKCWSTPNAAPFAAEISNFVPVLQRSVIIEPMLPSSKAEAQRDAARRVIGNAEKLARFAARGAKIERNGRRAPRTAPLADPRAEHDEDLVPAVDAALRCIVASMLKMTVPSLPNTDGSAEVQACLQYLRKRIGVPRDMSVHTAQQFRQSIEEFCT